MDEEVWSKLPDEVAENIFSRLTVSDILRAGSTCSSLRAFVSSLPSISSFFSSVSPLLFLHPSNAAFGMAWNFSAWAHDGNCDAWLKLSLDFLRPNLPELAYPVASAGGLLCVGSGHDFVICNPISRSWRKLCSVPHTVSIEDIKEFHVRFRKDSAKAFGLICDSISGTYDFFIIHQPYWGNYAIALHYSSSLSQWRVLPPLVISVSHLLHSNTITFCNSRLYTLWSKYRSRSLVVFAFSNNIWTKIESPDCTSASSSKFPVLKAFLMDIHGSLHMVGLLGPDGHRDFDVRSVCIWTLHVESNEWMEVTRMPSSILQEFSTCMEFAEVQCWGKDGVMYMKSFWSAVLMFDLGKTEWKWLKDIEMAAADLGGVILKPSLVASV